MSRILVKGLLAGIATSLVAVMIPSGASAAKNIGKTFVPETACAGGHTFLQTSFPGRQYEAPSPGVITSWRHRASVSPPQLKLKVGRPVTGNDYRIIGESGVVTPVAGEPNTYPVSIRVREGDVLGLYAATTGDCGSLAGGAFRDSYVNEDAPVGETRTFTPGEGLKLDISAGFKPYRCAGQDADLAGTNGPDVLVGTPGTDVIVGLGGADRIKGLGGNDRICGGNGRDRLRGQRGNDILKGSKGRDKLNGGGGTDTCAGGPGDDTARKCEVERSI